MRNEWDMKMLKGYLRSNGFDLAGRGFAVGHNGAMNCKEYFSVDRRKKC